MLPPRGEVPAVHGSSCPLHRSTWLGTGKGSFAGHRGSPNREGRQLTGRSISRIPRRTIHKTGLAVVHDREGRPHARTAAGDCPKDQCSPVCGDGLRRSVETFHHLATGGTPVTNSQDAGISLGNQMLRPATSSPVEDGTVAGRQGADLQPLMPCRRGGRARRARPVGTAAVLRRRGGPRRGRRLLRRDARPSSWVTWSAGRTSAPPPTSRRGRSTRGWTCSRTARSGASTPGTCGNRLS